MLPFNIISMTTVVIDLDNSCDRMPGKCVAVWCLKSTPVFTRSNSLELHIPENPSPGLGSVSRYPVWTGHFQIGKQQMVETIVA